MLRFLSIGEIMVELSPEAGNTYRMGFAGDTFNTAWYARKSLPAEWDVAYGTCLGRDALSDQVAQFVADHGISTDTIRRHPNRTVGLYMIQLQEGERSFSYWRGQSAAKTLADDPDWLTRILSGVAVAYLSGITLAILSPDRREALCTALTQARANGTHVAFDTNLRLRLWDSADAAREGLMMGARVADTVLPSFDEEQELFGDTTPDDTITRYANAGADLVVVKNGADGVVACEAGTVTQYDLTPVKVVDSTAAGDSFAAGLLSALVTGQPLSTAVQAANTLAGRVVRGKGALVEEAVT